MSVCLTPFMVDNPKLMGEKIPVPCGRCPPCFGRRTSQWSFRLRVEARQHLVSSFVTLTYDPQFLPKSDNGFATLVKRDLQLFFKNLRQINKRKYGIEKKVIYYAAGEYGTHTFRPHYHIILFNVPNGAVLDAWTRDRSPIGHVHFGSVSDASVGYCLKYINKKLINKKRHARDDRQKEFQLCSKGIGAAYLTPQMVKWHKDDPADRCLVMLEDGQKVSLPRYFREKIFNEDEKQIIFDRMQEIAIEKEYELWMKHGNNTEQWKHDETIGIIEKHNYRTKLKIDKL